MNNLETIPLTKEVIETRLAETISKIEILSKDLELIKQNSDGKFETKVEIQDREDRLNSLHVVKKELEDQLL